MFSLESNEWQAWECQGNAPCPRNFHSACILKDRLYVFGGKSNGYHSDLYCLDLASRNWRQQKFKTKAPLARYGHCLFDYNGDLYVMGGYDQHGFCCDRIFQFSLMSGLWKTIEPEAPLPTKSNTGRYHHSCSVYQDSVLIFAGKGPDSVLGDLIQFFFGSFSTSRSFIVQTFSLTPHNLTIQTKDTKTWRVLSSNDPQGPAPRWGHSSIVVGHILYIYGGRDNVSQFNDMYAFDLKTKKWSVVASAPSNASSATSMSVSVPQHRYFHGAALYNNSIYFVWGKNIYDFCFADILQYSLGAQPTQAFDLSSDP